MIYEKNSNEQTKVASLTKIMTCLVSLENISNLDDTVTVQYQDLIGLKGYAVAGFRVGDEVSYKDLLYALMLPSGADAALALSNNIDNFIDKMNNKAKELNMTNTSFSNPIGMDNDNNYSTAADLSKLLVYSLKNNTFKTIFSSDDYNAQEVKRADIKDHLSREATLTEYLKNKYYPVIKYLL